MFRFYVWNVGYLCGDDVCGKMLNCLGVKGKEICWNDDWKSRNGKRIGKCGMGKI